MANLDSIKYSINVTGTESIEYVKNKLRRIRLLSHELEAQLDSFNEINIELKPVDENRKEVKTMKYFFILDSKRKRHIAIAENKESLKNVLDKANVKAASFYELKPDTFDQEGFLISDK